jgi:hypothetical protein
MGLVIAILLLAGEPDDELAALSRNRTQMREARIEAERLRTWAHGALDRGEYEAAASAHRRSREAGRRAEELQVREAGMMRSVAEALLPRLDDDAVEVREKAERQLVGLGPGALPILGEAAKGRSAEAAYRIRSVLERLGRMEIGIDGRLHQWAVTARASSEYTPTDWSAMQATGKPDTFVAGDARTAWASREADAGDEWLELGYENAVTPTRVRVHETFNPGAVVKIEGRDEKLGWRVLWQGREPTREGARWLEVDAAPGGAIRAIRLTLDSAGVAGWNEIDAVELIGDSVP